MNISVSRSYCRQWGHCAFVFHYLLFLSVQSVQSVRWWQFNNEFDSIFDTCRGSGEKIPWWKNRSVLGYCRCFLLFGKKFYSYSSSMLFHSYFIVFPVPALSCWIIFTFSILWIHLRQTLNSRRYTLKIHFMLRSILRCLSIYQQIKLTHQRTRLLPIVYLWIDEIVWNYENRRKN